MSTNVPGLYLPKVSAPLAGTPGASAIAARNDTMNRQASLANAVGGFKRGMNKKRGTNRRGGAIIVPQMPGDTSNANGVFAQSAGISIQSAENARYDAAAMKKGGTMKKGGRRMRTAKMRTNKRKTRGKKRKTRRHKK